MQDVEEESEIDVLRTRFHPAPFLIILGLFLVAIGFGLIALTTVTGLLRPITLYIDSGAIIFVLGIVSMGLAWKSLD